jgi:hypothetical protein
MRDPEGCLKVRRSLFLLCLFKGSLVEIDSWTLHSPCSVLFPWGGKCLAKWGFVQFVRLTLLACRAIFGRSGLGPPRDFSPFSSNYGTAFISVVGKLPRPIYNPFLQFLVRLSDFERVFPMRKQDLHPLRSL